MVRFAPAMVVGMLVAYFCGGVGRAVVIACSAAAFVCFAVLKRKFAVNVAGFLAGIVIMLCFVRSSVAPVMKYSGEVVQTTFCVDKVVGDTNGTQHIIATLKIGGVKTKARLFADNHLEEGQTALAEISFRENDEEWELYNLANGILLSGEAEIIGTSEVSEGYIWLHFIGKIRQYLAEIVAEYIPGDLGALALSLMFGMDELLPKSISEALCVCGAYHFTAVSGTHFSVFAAIFLSHIPSHCTKLKSFAALAFIPLVLLFFGTSGSLIRAAAMFGIFGLGGIFLRQTQILNTLCAAVALICMISPSSVLDIGFGMSVMGVLGSGVVGTKAVERLNEILPRKPKMVLRFLQPMVISACAVICTAPLTVMAFGGVSLVGTFTTIILMPLIGVGMLLVIVLGGTGLGIAAVPLGILMKLISFIIGLFGSSNALWLAMNYSGAVVVCIAVMAGVFAWVMAPFGLFEATAACAAAMMVLSVSLTLFMQNVKSDFVIIENNITSAQIIVRQREAVVMVYGTGRGIYEQLSSALRQNGIRKITDLSIIDADYNGAVMVEELSEKYRIERISTNDFAFGVYK